MHRIVAEQLSSFVEVERLGDADVVVITSAKPLPLGTKLEIHRLAAKIKEVSVDHLVTLVEIGPRGNMNG